MKNSPAYTEAVAMVPSKPHRRCCELSSIATRSVDLSLSAIENNPSAAVTPASIATGVKVTSCDWTLFSYE